MTRAPTLCIGLPVYNGAAGLATALDSLLSQELSDLEVVVSDNGSTDATPDVCRQFANRDPRVHIVRAEANRGPTWNFNRALDECRHGRYFMWAAHDDRRAPQYASSCIRLLESRPEAALCGTHTAFVGPAGEPTGEIDPGISTLGLRPADRAALYARWVDRNSIFYGIYRTSALAGRRLQNCIGNDQIFLVELALAHAFHALPEVMMWRRTGGASRTVASIARTMGLRRHVPFPFHRFEIDRRFWMAAGRAPGLSPEERRRARREILTAVTRNHLRRLLKTPAARTAPSPPGVSSGGPGRRG